MIDRFNDIGSVDDEDLGVLVVRSSTGQLVGVYWGSRYDICNAVDEVTDPNECEFQMCEPGGILFSCFLGDEEISVQEYSQQADAVIDADDDLSADIPDIAFEGFCDNSLDIFSNDGPWHPLVPSGYRYIAGFGLQKIESEWN